MKKILIVLALLLIAFPVLPINAATSTVSSKLKGKILLQVESKGEAWYVHPITAERYYMADGNEAYNIMRNLGVGIKNSDLDKLKNNKNSALKQKGKIFLQVESKGEAYYVNSDGTLYYLQNGAEAYNIMRKLGLGITNNDLAKINTSKSAERQNTSSIKPTTNVSVVKQENKITNYTNSNNETNKNIADLNNAIFSLSQTKSQNQTFIRDRENDLNKYPNYYTYQRSGKALIEEVTSENYLIDKLVNIENNLINELKTLLNTGVSTSDNAKQLESQINIVIGQIKTSQASSKELINTSVKDLSDEMKSEISEKQNLISQIDTQCTTPIKDMRQQILDIKSDYYIAVENQKKRAVSSATIYGTIARLTDEANLKIDNLNNQIDQKILDCSSLSAKLSAMAE